MLFKEYAKDDYFIIALIENKPNSCADSYIFNYKIGQKKAPKKWGFKFLLNHYNLS